MKHSHYFKSVEGLSHVDVYRVLRLFEVADPCLQHAIKKLLVAGGRGAKNATQDVQEAIDTLDRWKAMRDEDLANSPIAPGIERNNQLGPRLGPVDCLVCGRAGGHGGLQCPAMNVVAYAD